MCVCYQSVYLYYFFFFSSRRRHTRFDCDWSSDVCSSDLSAPPLSLNSRESPASAVVLPGGSTCRAKRSSESSASPWAKGGIRDADRVNEGTRLKGLICLGPIPSSTFARAPACTACQPLARQVC